MTMKGRSRFPPPSAAWRMAASSRGGRAISPASGASASRLSSTASVASCAAFSRLVNSSPMTTPELVRKQRRVKAEAEQFVDRADCLMRPARAIPAGGDDRAQEEGEEADARRTQRPRRAPARAVAAHRRRPAGAGARAGGAHPGLPAGRPGLDADDLGAASPTVRSSATGCPSTTCRNGWSVAVDGRRRTARYCAHRGVDWQALGTVIDSGRRDRPAARRLDHRHADGQEPLPVDVALLRPQGAGDPAGALCRSCPRQAPADRDLPQYRRVRPRHLRRGSRRPALFRPFRPRT